MPNWQAFFRSAVRRRDDTDYLGLAVEFFQLSLRIGKNSSNPLQLLRIMPLFEKAPTADDGAVQIVCQGLHPRSPISTAACGARPATSGAPRGRCKGGTWLRPREVALARKEGSGISR